MKSKKLKKEAAAKNNALGNALHKNKRIKKDVERAASELTKVNDILKQEDQDSIPVQVIEDAIAQNEGAEQIVAKAADELHQVNAVLAREVAERETIEAELAEVRDDLSKSMAKEEESRKLAHQDTLTGLPDRVVFDQVLDQGIAQEKRHGTGFAVLFVDIDNFKQINDTYGHDLGDKALVMVANRLQASVRKGDIVSRWGGDEFVCLLLEVKQAADVTHIAEKMVDQLAEDWQFDGGVLSIKASIGIAIYPDDGKTADILFKHADAAMYKAKKTKKRVVLFR